MEVKERLFNEIQELSKGIPVKWDRLTVSKFNLICYGWIPKNEKQSDFVVYFHIFDSNQSFFTTSSVKYSKRFAKNWKIEDLHTDCIVFDYFFKQQIRKTKKVTPKQQKLVNAELIFDEIVEKKK